MRHRILIILLSVLLVAGAYIYGSHSKVLEECSWDRIQSNAEMTACLKDLKSRLLKEKELAYNQYLSLDKGNIDPNFSIPLADVKEKTTTWYKSTDSYRKAYCEARVANYADGSGYFEDIEKCEIEFIRNDIHFLEERMNEIRYYSTNFTP